MNAQPKPTRRKPDLWIILLVLIVVIGSIVFIVNGLSEKKAEVSAKEIQVFLEDGKVLGLAATPAGGSNYGLYNFEATLNFEIHQGITKVYGVLHESQIPAILDAGLDPVTHVNVVQIRTLSNFSFWDIVLALLPILISVGIMIFLFRTLSKAAGGENKQAFDFGKSRARLNKSKEVTFADVAGCDEEKQELEEIIDFLKNPKKYVDMGAKIPKGVLLVGAPGTGKTLLAKAVAGEASVPFFSISGSDFVEMFVGVGASRVRDLFKVAKENSPCIIFIDEIDAVGRQRGAGLGGGHDEREQTLNQLLVEMDGFSTNVGIIMMAATNRPDVLDPALLRPGRFDRQITIDLPDVIGREAILKVHAKNKKIDAGVKFDQVSARIPGFSGADIANLLNEAALLAARDNRTVVAEKDIDEAMDRVMMGPAKRSKKYTEKERKTVAFHEAGHAVIGLKLSGSMIVQKVTIIPRGRAGGYNLMTPSQETYLTTKEEFLASITSFLGGRVAEEIVFNTVTNGAYQDFKSATRIARAMVTEYGMSDLGPIQYESGNDSIFLGRDYFKEKNFSDQVALEIDKEVRHIITTCYNNAKEIISTNRDLLDKISHYLLEAETLNKADIDEISTTGTLKWWDKLKKSKSLGATPSAA